jgi:hypothetical protein
MSIWIKPKEGEFNFLEETSREKINLLKFQDIPPNEVSSKKLNSPSFGLIQILI